ncbi:hypothetical protein PRIPAC_76634 [Pristionchus pacificus]|uniref:Alpha-galactosidase n=1 Tax=Pristionchus pacificus TaxID=54126 RepID=A0A2A6CS68_PRIPA|nr:hypothetical protein PRIPAC_76634 [Pristionchus pacificus]|eukprot:PDM80883.1 hypothetical protein PRIPAC_35886 [Pristionchus pacificus]
MGGSLASFLLFFFIFLPFIRSRSQNVVQPCNNDETCLFIKLVSNDRFELVPIENSNLIGNKKYIRFLVNPQSDKEWKITIASSFHSESKMTIAEKIQFSISSESATMSPEGGKVETVMVTHSGEENLAIFSLTSAKSLRSTYHVKKVSIVGRKNNNGPDERNRILEGFWRRIDALIVKRKCNGSFIHVLCDHKDCIKAVITPSRVDCGDTGAQLQIRSIDNNITLLDHLHCSNNQWMYKLKMRFVYIDLQETDRIQCVKLGPPTTTTVSPLPPITPITTTKPTISIAPVTSDRPAHDCDCSTASAAAAHASPTVIGAIGGASGLLLIVMIMVIFVLMRRRRKKVQIASATSVKATEKEIPPDKVLTTLGEKTWNWPQQQENSITGLSSAKVSAENADANKTAEPLKEAENALVTLGNCGLKMDAQTFADWDVDYLKLDGCNINLDLMPVGYPEMGRALNATGRPIVYSCSWPAYLINQPQKVDYNVIGESCNLWRNFDDINSSWKSIMSIISYYDHMQDKHIPTHGPGKWHDPDMLVIGNAGITPDMARAQMTIWCIWSAPLIMSNDLRNIAPVFKEILQNRAVIAVDQDPLGKMGRLVANTTDVGVYIKAMTPVDPQSGDFSYSIGILNRNAVNRNSVEFVLGRLGLNSPGGYRIDDLWSGQLVGVFKPTDNFQTIVNPTGANMFKATPVALADLKGLRFATFK